MQIDADAFVTNLASDAVMLVVQSIIVYLIVDRMLKAQERRARTQLRVSFAKQIGFLFAEYARLRDTDAANFLLENYRISQAAVADFDRLKVQHLTALSPEIEHAANEVRGCFSQIKLGAMERQVAGVGSMLELTQTMLKELFTLCGLPRHEQAPLLLSEGDLRPIGELARSASDDERVPRVAGVKIL